MRWGCRLTSQEKIFQKRLQESNALHVINQPSSPKSLSPKCTSRSCELEAMPCLRRRKHGNDNNPFFLWEHPCKTRPLKRDQKRGWLDCVFGAPWDPSLLQYIIQCLIKVYHGRSKILVVEIFELITMFSNKSNVFSKYTYHYFVLTLLNPESTHSTYYCKKCSDTY